MGTRVEELLIEVSEYPHVSSSSTLREAVRTMQEAIRRRGTCFQPMALLVFDEKHQLAGTLRMREVLRGLEPRFLAPSAKAQGVPTSEDGLAMLWGTLFSEEIRERAERPVREFMRPARVVLSPEDGIGKAAYLMIREDVLLLPVVRDGRVLGIVRMMEIFEEVADILGAP